MLLCGALNHCKLRAESVWAIESSLQVLWFSAGMHIYLLRLMDESISVDVSTGKCTRVRAQALRKWTLSPDLMNGHPFFQATQNIFSY